MPQVQLPIETERLCIRALRIEDAEELHELYSDRDAMRFLASKVPTTIAEHLRGSACRERASAPSP